MNDFSDAIPFNDHLGIVIEEKHDDGLTISCRMRPEFRNGHGVLHGGITATLADVAVGVAVKSGVTELLDYLEAADIPDALIARAAAETGCWSW